MRYSKCAAQLQQQFLLAGELASPAAEVYYYWELIYRLAFFLCCISNLAQKQLFTKTVKDSVDVVRKSVTIGRGRCYLSTIYLFGAAVFGILLLYHKA